MSAETSVVIFGGPDTDHEGHCEGLFYIQFGVLEGTALCRTDLRVLHQYTLGRYHCLFKSEPVKVLPWS